jgi:hypothetical protein
MSDDTGNGWTFAGSDDSEGLPADNAGLHRRIPVVVKATPQGL